MSSGFLRNSSIALAVGNVSNWTWRRLASFFTSSMTGKAPVPVPMTSRLHFHGIFSSAESGVWPKDSRNFLEGFFLRLRTWPLPRTSPNR